MQKVQTGIRMHDLGVCTPVQLAEKLAGYGLHCGQLAVQKSIPGVGSYHDVDDALLAGIKTAFAAQDIHIGVLGCYIAPVQPDVDDRMRQLDNFAAGIRCAAALGAGCIGTETPLRVADPKAPQAFEDLCRSVETMLETARPLGVTIALEPVRYDVLHSPEVTARLLARFKNEPVGIIFDAFNLLHPGRVAGQDAFWRECMDAFGGSILACHIKDAVPNADNSNWDECVLGRGVLDYTEICKGLARLQKRGPLLREGFHEEAAATELAYLEALASNM